LDRVLYSMINEKMSNMKKVFFCLMTVFSCQFLKGQIFFQASIEPKSIIAKKNEVEILNLTNYYYSTQNTSGGSFGLSAFYDFNWSKFDFGIDVSSRTFANRFIMEYDAVSLTQSQGMLDNIFNEYQIKASLALMYREKDWYINLKYGETFGLIKENRDQFFLEQIGFIDGEFKHLAIVERFGRQAGRVTELEFGFYISQKFSISGRADFHFVNQNYYFLEIFSNQFNTENEFEQVVKLNLRKHSVNLAWGINYHFGHHFKKKDKKSLN